MVRIILATVVGSIVLFMWSFVSWTVLDWHTENMNEIPANQEMIEMMKQNMYEPGVYIYPPPPSKNTKEAMNAAEDAKKAGPWIVMNFNRNGVDKPMYTEALPISFGMNFITAFLAASIVFLTRAKATSFIARWGVMLGIAWMVVLMSDGMSWNWFHWPDQYTLTNAADKLAGVLLMGLPIALIIGTDKATVEAAKATKQSKTPEAPANTEEPPPARPI